MVELAVRWPILCMVTVFLGHPILEGASISLEFIDQHGREMFAMTLKCSRHARGSSWAVLHLATPGGRGEKGEKLHCISANSITGYDAVRCSGSHN